MREIKGNNICPRCGCKIEGGYCECFQTEDNTEISRVTAVYKDGRHVDLVKGYLISIDDDGNSSCINFNV